jgi:hypothetical protein
MQAQIGHYMHGRALKFVTIRTISARNVNSLGSEILIAGDRAAPKVFNNLTSR